MSRLGSKIHRPILCYVTDRRSLDGSEPDSIAQLLKKIREVAHAGVDWVQLREKDLGGRACAELTVKALEIRNKFRTDHREILISVNDRLDIAAAEGADGVHLGDNSLPVADARRLAPPNFLIGASVHSLERAKRAETEGADYVIFGPVFATPSKAEFGEPQGLERLGKICRSVSVPVLAIGGITLQNAMHCLSAGAAGVGAIRLFQDAADSSSVVQALRGN